MSNDLENKLGQSPSPTGGKKGVVSTPSLRVRADHSTSAEVVAGLVDGDEVTILGVWSDGTNKWAQLENGWAAIEYDGKTLIKVS